MSTCPVYSEIVCEAYYYAFATLRSPVLQKKCGQKFLEVSVTIVTVWGVNYGNSVASPIWFFQSQKCPTRVKKFSLEFVPRLHKPCREIESSFSGVVVMVGLEGSGVELELVLVAEPHEATDLVLGRRAAVRRRLLHRAAQRLTMQTWNNTILHACLLGARKKSPFTQCIVFCVEFNK